MREFVVSGDDSAFTICVILRTTSTTKDLENVENSEVDKGSLLGIVDLSTLSEREGEMEGGKGRERGREEGGREGGRNNGHAWGEEGWEGGREGRDRKKSELAERRVEEGRKRKSTGEK